MDQSDAKLEMSVSFGRFENDVLSWEKWSSFSPNKYLEEVGSLSTPGSVAQKAAYFESHYKKIAAQKAEALEQERAMNCDAPDPDISSESEIYHGSGISNGAEFIEEKMEKFRFSSSPCEGNNRETEDDGNAASNEVFESGSCNTALMNATTCEDEGLKPAPLNNGNSVAEAALDEVSGDVHLSLTDAESDTIDFLPEHSQASDAVKKHDATKEAHSSDLNDAGNLAQKITQTKERSFAGTTKKKVASSPTKKWQTSLMTSVNSGRGSISNPTSVHQSLKQKSGTPQPKNKNLHVVDDQRKPAPTSLHMSLNSAVSLGDSSSRVKKSSIMEKLGNKDIVKRAFKSFQKRDFASSPVQKPSPMKHEPTAAIKSKISVPRTPIKLNGRLTASTQNPEKSSTPRSLSGTRSNPLPSGSHKMFTPDKKYATGLSPQTLSKDERAEKRREFIKKLGANAIARAAENAHRSSTSKSSC